MKSETLRDNSHSTKISFIQGVLGGNVSSTYLEKLLELSNGDPQEAINRYFSDPIPEKSDEKQEYQDEILVMKQTVGDDVNDEVLRDYLLQQKGDIQEALDTYFENMMAEDVSSSFHKKELPNQTKKKGIANGKEYEVTMFEPNFKWELDCIFGRIVVKHIEANGSADKAGIQPADVLVSCSGNIVNDSNCDKLASVLTSEKVLTPVHLRFRRAQTEVTKNEGNTTEEYSEDIQDKKTDSISEPIASSPDAFSMSSLLSGISLINETIEGERSKNFITYLLLSRDLNVESAINQFFVDETFTSDLRDIIGYKWLYKPEDCPWSTYQTQIDTPSLGLTVENLMERTIVVGIKPGGAAEISGVRLNSWLIEINGHPIHHLTHKELLHEIELSPRPLQLRFHVLPAEEVGKLRKQLASLGRPVQNKLLENGVYCSSLGPLLRKVIPILPDSILEKLWNGIGDVKSWGNIHKIDESECVPTPFGTGVPMKADSRAYIINELSDRRLFNTVAPVAYVSKFSSKDTKIRPSTNNMHRNLFISLFDTYGNDEMRWIDLTKKLVHALSQVKVLDYISNIDNDSDYHDVVVHVFIYILELVCEIEIGDVWESAVETILSNLDRLPDNAFAEICVPLILRLSVSMSPLKRITAIRLLPMVYSRLIDSSIRVQLRGLYERFTNEDALVVKRACAYGLRSIADVIDLEFLPWIFMMLEKISNDVDWEVRFYALSTCAHLAKSVPIRMKQVDEKMDHDDTSVRLFHCRLLPFFNNFATDSAQEVRVSAVEHLPTFILMFGPDLEAVFLDQFVAFLNDNSNQVKQSALEIMHDLCETLFIQIGLSVDDINGMLKIVPKDLKYLELQECHDGNVDDTREENNAEDKLTADYLESVNILETLKNYCSIQDLCSDIIAKRRAIRVTLLPSLYQLIDSSNSVIRLECKLTFVKLSSFLHIDIPEECFDSNFFEEYGRIILEMCHHAAYAKPHFVVSKLLDMVRSLIRCERNWRRRFQGLQCIGELSASIRSDHILQELLSLSISMLNDSVYEVREAACQTIAQLSSCSDNGTILNIIASYFPELVAGSFRKCLLALTLVDLLSSTVNKDGLAFLIPFPVELAEHRVPNVRLRALSTLRKIILRTNNNTDLKSSCKNVVHRIRNGEDDEEVRDMATILERTLDMI